LGYKNGCFNNNDFKYLYIAYHGLIDLASAEMGNRIMEIKGNFNSFDDPLRTLIVDLLLHNSRGGSMK